MRCALPLILFCSFMAQAFAADTNETDFSSNVKWSNKSITDDAMVPRGAVAKFVDNLLTTEPSKSANTQDDAQVPSSR